jgi:redox-sensitive bicupin YhaK (pirin superfamily)
VYKGIEVYYTLSNNYKGIEVWNNLPTQYKEPAKSYDSIKTIMKKYLSDLNLIE